MPGSVSIFISYRRKEPDSSLAHVIADALRQAQHGVFINTDISLGVNWSNRIADALERSHYLVVLLSHEAANSEYVMEEIARARDLAVERDGQPAILPIRVQLPLIAPLPYHISGYLRTITQETWETDNDTPQLIDRILTTIANGRSWLDDVSDEDLNDLPEAAQPASPQLTSPAPHADPRSLLTPAPGGAMEVASPFYVSRQADEQVDMEVRRHRGIAIIRGPRQTGKTSLMMRIFSAFRHETSSLRAVFIDLQRLSRGDLASLDSIWRVIAMRIARQLQARGWGTSRWNTDLDFDENLADFLDDFVFVTDERPLLICLDEADRVFEAPIKAEFFSSIRALYNAGTIEQRWSQIRWVLSTSSEPSFFIDDLNESPFNIGRKVELNAFTLAEITTFVQYHELNLDRDTLHQIMIYVGGRPYLVHLLLYHFAEASVARAQIFDARSAGGGIFRDHLRRYLIQFQHETALADAMKSVIAGQGSIEARLEARLEASGLVKRDSNQRVVSFCQLYSEFFRNEL